MDPTLIATAFIIVAIGGGAVAFMGGGSSSKSAAKRIKTLSQPAAKRKSGPDLATIKRRQNTQEALKQLSQSERESRRRRFSVRGQLDQAGLSMSPSVFWIASLVLAVVGVGVGFMTQGIIGACAGGFIFGLGLPRWFLRIKLSGRQKKFASQLSDAIDVIVRGVKSGLPLSQCMRIIASESPEPLRSEFLHIVDAQAMGMPLDQSMRAMYERMPLPEVNFFAIVLTIQQKTGGNLSESLGNLSSVLRARKMLKEKIKAVSAEAKSTAMIIGALPFCVMGLVYLTRPDYIQTLFIHPTGHLILGGGALMMGTGIMVMRNMINFKI